MKNVHITKDSFIPVINGCIFSWEKLKSREDLITILNKLKYIDYPDKFIFTQLIILTTQGLGIKSGSFLYEYINKTDNGFSYIKDKYINKELSKNKILDLLIFYIKLLDEYKNPKTKIVVYKNILAITLYKIGKLQ